MIYNGNYPAIVYFEESLENFPKQKWIVNELLPILNSLFRKEGVAIVTLMTGLVEPCHAYNDPVNFGLNCEQLPGFSLMHGKTPMQYHKFPYPLDES